MPWKRWGDRLKTHMRSAGVTQEAVAERLDVSQGSIAHWLSGRREINLTDFFRLCEAAGAAPAIILFGDSEEMAVLGSLQKFLADNPALQHMIAQPSVPPLIAAAALPPAPRSRRRAPKRVRVK